MKIRELKKVTALNTIFTERKLLLSKDIWDAEKLGIKPNGSHSAYYLNFTRINPLWLKSAIKQFVAYESITKAFTTCLSYIGKLQKFSDFICENYPNIKPDHIDRHLVIEYISYLTTTSWKASTKRLGLIHLRTFIETASEEGWLPLPKVRIIFDSDLPKDISRTPRFIPEKVMDQLMHYLPTLPGQHRRLIYLLQETGRRISEICTMPYDCLIKDKDGTYFLEITEHKTKKAYIIPITMECAQVIKEQQRFLKSLNRENIGFLFLGKSKKVHHVGVRQINNVLNQLAKNKEIRDDQGNIWHFHPHQFRHTVGTRMINAGISQPIVQRYLGHETPEMTNRYAYIHDCSLKDAFFQFHGNLINIHGNSIEDTRIKNSEEQWLKQNILAQALPNGYCGLPAKQIKCPHANACLSCAHFRTDESFLPQHESQLDETNKIIHTAKKNGWQRQHEMNQIIKINLESIISTLKGRKSNESK